MGIWLAMNTSAEEVKRRLPDLAPLKGAYSAAHDIAAASVSSVRSASPDLSKASRILLRSYDGSSNAASWLYRAVRFDAPHRVRAIVSEPHVQDRIGRTAWNLLDHTLEHGTRPYTGGIPVYRILKEGLSGGRPSSEGKEMIEMRRRLEKLEALAARKAAEDALLTGILGSDTSPYAHGSLGSRKPADVIGSFMSGGFRGADFIKEQVIPVIDESQRRARKDFMLCNLI